MADNKAAKPMSKSAVVAQLAETTKLTKKQIECVQKHLALVFKHEIDPSEGSSSLQEALNKIHEPRPQPPGDPPGHSHGEPGHVIYRC